jgi:quinol monooxygenase YgiN
MAAVAADPFTQLVVFTAKSESDREKLVDAWRVATAFVVKEEKGTVTHTYEIYTPKKASESEKNDVLALETYNSKADLDSKHMVAAPISTFIAEATKLIAKPVALTFLRPCAGFLQRSPPREAEVRASGVKPHCLVVTLNFQSHAALKKNVANCAGLIAHTTCHEPNTLSYQFYTGTPSPVSAGDESATQLVIFERYVTEHDLIETHFNSDAFKSFVKTNTEDPEVKQTTPPSFRHYEELAIGFVGPV